MTVSEKNQLQLKLDRLLDTEMYNSDDGTVKITIKVILSEREKNLFLNTDLWKRYESFDLKGNVLTLTDLY